MSTSMVSATSKRQHFLDEINQIAEEYLDSLEQDRRSIEPADLLTLPSGAEEIPQVILASRCGRKFFYGFHPKSGAAVMTHSSSLAMKIMEPDVNQFVSTLRDEHGHEVDVLYDA